jgi:hypothetical protein
MDLDSQPPPELELMETGEVPAISSDAEASLNTDPEPLPPPDMDISTDAGINLSLFLVIRNLQNHC